MSNKFNLKDVQSAYFGLLTEAKIDDLLEKSELDPDSQEKIRNINNRLSNKTKYVKFLIDNITNLSLNDVDNIIYIDKYTQAFAGLDIDKTTVDEIHRLVNEHRMKKNLEKIHPEAEKIFEDEDILIVSPLTYEAAVHHGKGTKWCISTSNPQYWSDYTKNFERFYFFISKKYPITNRFAKVAVQIKQNGEIDEFRDRLDETIKESDIDIYDFDKYKQYLKPMEMTLDIVIKKYGLKYNKSTGSYDCDGDIEILNSSPLIKDGKFVIKFGYIKGSFDCSNCTSLISLEGAPAKVGRGFDCHGCTSLTSLKGCPEKVDGSFYCSGCSSLTSLEGCPKEINSNFDCSHCSSIISLEGGPKEVGGHFYCYNCISITSLEGCPEKVDGSFNCHNCSSITSLKGCPEKIGGSFNCYDCSSLTSLEGCPKKINGYFRCHQCASLTSLEGCPEKVSKNFICFGCKEKFTDDDVKKLCEVWGDITV